MAAVCIVFFFYCCSVPDRQGRSSVYRWERVTSKLFIVVSLDCVREVEACCALFCVCTSVEYCVSGCRQSDRFCACYDICLSIV